MKCITKEQKEERLDNYTQEELENIQFLKQKAIEMKSIMNKRLDVVFAKEQLSNICNLLKALKKLYHLPKRRGDYELLIKGFEYNKNKRFITRLIATKSYLQGFLYQWRINNNE